MRVFRSSFFKVPRHSKFEYQPRYSESGDESAKSENRRISFERGKLPFSDKSIITGSLRRSSIAFRKKESQRRKMRIYILLGALIAVLLILLQNL